MLDIQFIRENAELVKEKSAQKGYPVDIDQLLGFDTERKVLLAEAEDLRHRRNELAKTQGQKPTSSQITEGKQLKDQLADIEHKLSSIEQEFNTLLKSVPNMPTKDVPVGSSEDDNVVAKTWGQKPSFDFEPISHYQLGMERGWVDKERAAKVAGSRFAYLKGDLVKLQWAMMQFAMDVLTDETKLKQIAKQAKLDVDTKPFIPVLPPLLITNEQYDAMERLEPRDDRYKIDGQDLWLQGSAEHVLGPMHSGEILNEAELPLRYAGFATSFRREAGTYGKDLEGIIRMHQFDKLEMESLTTADQSLNEHLFLIAIQEYLMQQLALPYRVLMKCTFDIGKPNARGVDIEAWLPSQNKYRETHTADYMTDYQARRLQTRVKRGDKTELVHTNDATALAQRPLIAILENHQTAEGKIKVPEALVKYLGGRELL
jgi:seryl-tRNA synthetase